MSFQTILAGNLTNKEGKVETPVLNAAKARSTETPVLAQKKTAIETPVLDSTKSSFLDDAVARVNGTAPVVESNKKQANTEFFAKQSEEKARQDAANKAAQQITDTVLGNTITVTDKDGNEKEVQKHTLQKGQGDPEFMNAFRNALLGTKPQNPDSGTYDMFSSQYETNRGLLSLAENIGVGADTFVRNATNRVGYDIQAGRPVNDAIQEFGRTVGNAYMDSGVLRGKGIPIVNAIKSIPQAWENAKDVAQEGYQKLDEEGLKKVYSGGENYAKNVEEAYSDLGEGWKTAGNIAQNIGSQLAPMAAQKIPVIGKAVSSGMFYLGAAGGATEEALADGADWKSAMTYGAASGGLEAATEVIGDVALKGLDALAGKSAAAKAVESFLEEHPILKGTFSRFVNNVSEGNEELLSGVLSPFLKSIYNGKTMGENWQEEVTVDGLFEQFLGGFAVSAIMGIPSVGTDIINSQVEKVQQTVEENGAFSEETAEAMAEAADAIEPYDSDRAEALRTAAEDIVLANEGDTEAQTKLGTQILSTAMAQAETSENITTDEESVTETKAEEKATAQPAEKRQYEDYTEAELDAMDWEEYDRLYDDYLKRHPEKSTPQTTAERELTPVEKVYAQMPVDEMDDPYWVAKVEEAKAEMRGEKKPKAKPKVEAKVEPKAEAKVEPKVEAKTEPVVETKPEISDVAATMAQTIAPQTVEETQPVEERTQEPQTRPAESEATARDITTDKALAKILDKAERKAAVTVNGENYVSDTARLIRVTQSTADAVGGEYSDKVSKTADKIVNAEYSPISTPPTEHKGADGIVALRFVTDDGQVILVQKKQFSYFDGGKLYGTKIDGFAPVLKVENADGSVLGYLLGVKTKTGDVAASSQPGETHLKSFAKTGKRGHRSAKAPVEQTSETPQTPQEVLAQQATQPVQTQPVETQPAQQTQDIPSMEQNSMDTTPQGFDTSGTRTSQSAMHLRDVSSDDVKADVAPKFANGEYNYMPLKNDAVAQAAERRIKRDGYTASLASWTAAAKEGKTGADFAATGALLYNAAVESGDTKLSIDILTTFAAASKNTAQGLQALRLLSDQTPTGQLYAIQKTVSNLNDELEMQKHPTTKSQTKAAEKAAEKNQKVVDTVETATAEAVDKTVERLEVDDKFIDEVFTFEYEQEAADELSHFVRKEAYNRSHPKTHTATSMDTLVKHLQSYARDKFDKVHPENKNPTSTELLTELIENKDFFDSVWKKAQDSFDNQDLESTEDTVGRFTSGGILDDTADNILHRALYESAIATDETANYIRQQAQLMSRTKIAAKIASDLVSKTGAKGKNAGYIKQAANAYVDRVLEKSGSSTVSSITRKGMTEIGEKFREIAVTSRFHKDAIKETLTDYIVDKYAVSINSAEEISGKIVEEYDSQLHQAMESEIRHRFGKKGARQSKDYLESLIEAVNLGTFESEYADDAAEKLFGSNKIRLDESLVEEFQLADTQEERDKIVKKMQKNIAKQIKPTLMDKWTAMRYTNMLFSFTTQGRNIISNTAMAATAKVKNTAVYGMERLLQLVSGGKYKRNTSLVISPKMFGAALKDYKANADYVDGSSRYNDRMTSSSFMKGVDDQRRIFANPVMEGTRKLTNAMTEGGDVIFIAPQYARALGGFLEARGIDGETFKGIVEGTISPDMETQMTIDEGRAFAAKEAQEATFHDSNATSEFVARAMRGKNVPVWARVLGEGIAPFRKTPANVAVRAVEYSPLGILDTAVKSVKAIKGDATGYDIVNSLAKTMTGTGLFALGMYLASKGMLRGKDDDDDQEAFDKLQGAQDYSLVIGDHSYTIDWLAPDAIPLFLGNSVYEMIHDGGFEVEDFSDVLASVSDPLLEMTMLSSLNETLDSIEYSDHKLGTILTNAFLSLMGQSMTSSMGGQIERTIESGRTTTFRDADTSTGKNIQYYLGKAFEKVPLWYEKNGDWFNKDGDWEAVDYNQAEYVDAWGRTEEDEPLLTRALQNFFSPGYYSKMDSTEADKALQTLYNEEKNSGYDGTVLPSRIAQTETLTTYDEYGDSVDTRKITKDEYVQWQKIQGSTSLGMVNDLISLPMYSDMTGEQKWETVKAIYGYAKSRAMEELEPTTRYKTGFKDYSYLSNPSAFIAADESFSISAGNERKRDYGNIDTLITDISTLPTDVQEALVEKNKDIGVLTEAKTVGIDSESYYTMDDSIKALTPVEGNASATQYQKFTYFATSDATDEQKDFYAKQYLSESMYGKYMAARTDGIEAHSYRAEPYEPNDIAVAYELYMTTKGTDKNGDGRTDTGSKKDNYITAMVEAGANEAEALYFYGLFK